MGLVAMDLTSAIYIGNNIVIKNLDRILKSGVRYSSLFVCIQKFSTKMND